MFTGIGMPVLKIYLWGACIIVGLFLFFGGLIFVAVQMAGKKPAKNDGVKKPSIFAESLRLLGIAAFFGVLWPYMAAYTVYTLLKQLIPQYAEDIRRHRDKKAKKAKTNAL